MVLPMWAFWLALAVMIVGLLGIVLPVLPGLLLIWLVALIYAIAERFATIDPITFVILTILAVTGYTANLWMGQLGAKAGGASFKSVLAGTVLGIIGALVGLWGLGIGAIPGGIIGGTHRRLFGRMVPAQGLARGVEGGRRMAGRLCSVLGPSTRARGADDPHLRLASTEGIG